VRAAESELFGLLGIEPPIVEAPKPAKDEKESRIEELLARINGGGAQAAAGGGGGSSTTTVSLMDQIKLLTAQNQELQKEKAAENQASLAIQGNQNRAPQMPSPLESLMKTIGKPTAAGTLGILKPFIFYIQTCTVFMHSNKSSTTINPTSMSIKQKKKSQKQMLRQRMETCRKFLTSRSFLPELDCETRMLMHLRHRLPRHQDRQPVCYQPQHSDVQLPA